MKIFSLNNQVVIDNVLCSKMSNLTIFFTYAVFGIVIERAFGCFSRGRGGLTKLIFV